MAAKVKINTGTQVIAARFLNAHVTDAASGNIKFQSFVNPNTSQQMLVADVDSATYVGDEADQSKLCRYYIAKVNRRTSKMRVYDAKLFSMKHYDEAFLQEEKEQLELQDTSSKLLEQTRRHMSNQLTQTFGASWKKKAVRERLQQEERAAQNMSGSIASSNYILENEGDVEEKLAKVQSDMESNRFGPPCNRDAESAAEVYTLDSIISDVEMAALEEKIDEFVNCTQEQILAWQREKMYPSFVLMQLHLLPMEEGRRRRQACILRYLSYLLELHNMKASQLCRKDPLPADWPQVVRKKLLNQFCLLSRSDTGRKKISWKISPRLKDDLIGYIIILALISNDFTLPTQHITADVRMLPKLFLTRAQALGCRVSTRKASQKSGREQNETFIILRTPLLFPKVRSITKKRQK